MKIAKLIKQQTAQSLVEIVVAIGLLSIVFAGSFQILHDSFFGISQELIATKAHYLVIEGVEGIRSIRDEDWNTISDGTWYFRYDETDPYNKIVVLEAGEESVWNVYTRKIEISSVRRDSNFKISESPSDEIDPNTKLVEVFVSWTYRGVDRTDSESIYLTNWARY